MIEQVGSYDPLPNEHNEKLVALNLERIRHWLGNGADVSTPVAELLGNGFLLTSCVVHCKSWQVCLGFYRYIPEATLLLGGIVRPQKRLPNRGNNNRHRQKKVKRMVNIVIN